jgi:hypothetical protein
MPWEFMGRNKIIGENVGDLRRGWIALHCEVGVDPIRFLTIR